MTFKTDREFARQLDRLDSLAHCRDLFHHPKHHDGNPVIYLCGNSLGLQPKSVRAYVEQELADWEAHGVEGHFRAKHPWMPYHENLTRATARLVGAQAQEVVVMNSLTVNLHLLMVSFYRPTPQRYKILIEANAFPSDQYAVKSQIAFHGYDPADAFLELPLREGEVTHRMADIADMLEKEGSQIALVLLGGVNYYTGQFFELGQISELAHKQGCVVGYDLAHAAGNVPLQLHDWNVDFAAWCSYKYLNSGPGSIAGCFVHERHADRQDLPRFAGWWGHDKHTRFKMGPEFQAIPGAEGWQLSNPPILPLAALRASMDIFDEAGMAALREKSIQLTSYLAFLVDEMGPEKISYITPNEVEARGCQLSLVVASEGKRVYDALSERGVVCDWREPDVIRVAPVPLYNSYSDINHFAEILKSVL